MCVPRNWCCYALCSVPAEAAAPEQASTAANANGRQQRTKQRRPSKAAALGAASPATLTAAPTKTEAVPNSKPAPDARRRGAPTRSPNPTAVTAVEARRNTSDVPAVESTVPKPAKRRGGARTVELRKTGATEAADSGAVVDDVQLPADAELLPAVQKAVEDLFIFDNLAERSPSSPSPMAGRPKPRAFARRFDRIC